MPVLNRIASFHDDMAALDTHPPLQRSA